MAHKDLKSYQTGISHSVDKEMAGFSHTLTCCLSKLRSSLEAGKRQLRVWLQYACSVVEALLYSSFGAPLVFFWSFNRNAEGVRTLLRLWQAQLSVKNIYSLKKS